ncbi:competence protein ComK [Peribacillus acanthi]|uniref:competence protein ComK n=1 Tax=Peribacillus acanthi TaxID=2171554 RepID=UPI000D3E9704|nr:competence protein ComK [Peribacillus acanthi]
MKKDSFIEEYEVTPYTLLIKPVQYGKKTYSQIFEWEGEYICPHKPMDIIKRSCEYYGSSYEGRKEGTRHLTGITHKSPIAVDPVCSILFFPTTSPVRSECMWVAYDHIMSRTKNHYGDTDVVFRNGWKTSLPLSSSSLDNQLYRTALLKNRYVQRIAETERKFLYVNRSIPKTKEHEKPFV